MRKRVLKAVVRGIVLAALTCAGPMTVTAQQPVAQTAAQAETSEVSSASRQAIDQYRIGPRDVLSIRVSAGKHAPELSAESVEVDECGRIPVASVRNEQVNEVQAAGLTRAELAETLRSFFLKYKRNPQVIVTVREYNSQPVAVNGAVAKPGQFQLRRAVRLLELVQFHAGGPTERASGRIQIARLPASSICGQEGVARSDNPVEFLVFNVRDTLKGIEQSNPYLQAGDVVTLPEAKEAYIVGNVLSPGPVLLREDSITLSRAIAMAGGTMPDTKKEKIRIIRQEPGSGLKKEIFVDLKAIDSRRAEDITLLPNDIIDVPTAGGRRLLRTLVGAVVPSVGQLPVRVIR